VLDAIPHIENLQNHGCEGCGSDPIHEGGYVRDPTGCKEGHLCPLKDNYKCIWDDYLPDDPLSLKTIPEGTTQNCDVLQHRYGPEKDCFLPLFCMVKRDIMQRLGWEVPPKVDMESQP
jgi:hypothetical protein